METQLTILQCDKHKNEDILTQVKKQLHQGSLQYLIFVTKSSACVNSKKQSHLPANYNRKQIIEQQIIKIHDEIKEKIKELADISSKVFPIDLIASLQALYKEEKYQQVIQKVDGHKESNFLKSQDPNISFILGNCYFKLKKYQQAILYYQIENSEEPLQQKANRLNNLATCLAQNKQNQQSLKIYAQALKYYIQIPQLDQSNLLFNIGTLYKNSSMFKQAQHYFTESLIERQNKSPYNEIMLYETHIELGKISKQVGNYEQSISNFIFAINYSKKNPSINPIKVLKQLCLLYEKLEKWSEALNHYDYLSDQYEKRNLNQGYIYEKVAMIHQKLRNFLAFSKFLKKSYEEYRREGNQRKMSDISSSMVAAEQYSKIELMKQKSHISLSYT